MSFQEQNPEKINQRELDALREVTAHPELATAAALHFCAKYYVCPPEWLVERALELICQLLKREKSSKRGRAAGAITRYQQDLWHLERWDAVKGIQYARQRSRRDLRI